MVNKRARGLPVLAVLISASALADFQSIGSSVIYSSDYRCSVPFWVRNDLDRDGRDDLVLALTPSTAFTSVSAPGELTFWKGQADGSLQEVTRGAFSGPVTAALLYSTVLVGDLNGDAISDVLIPDGGVDTYANGGPVGPWLGATPKLALSSNGRWIDRSAALADLPSTFLHTGGLGDIDGDGDLDAYMGSISAGANRTPYLLINDGTGVFTRNQARLPAVLIESGSQPTVTQSDGSRIGSGQQFTGSLFMDHDNDGDQDLLVLASDSTPNGLLLLNDGSGDFTRLPAIDLPVGVYGAGKTRYTNVAGGVTIEQGPGSISLEAEAADLNNDGYQDLVIVQTVQNLPINYRGGRLQILINQQGKGFVDESAARGAPGYDAAENYDSYHGTLGVSDINGDGYVDLIALRASTSYASQVFINDGSGRFARAEPAGLPTTGLLIPLTSNDPGIVRIASVNEANKRLVQSPGGTVVQCDLEMKVYEDRVTPTLKGLPVKRSFTNTGRYTAARFSGAATVGTSTTPQTIVTSAQTANIDMNVAVAPDDAGKKGRYFAVIWHIDGNGTSTWSYLGADGQYRPWSTRIADLLPATAVQSLDNRTLRIFTGRINAGEARVFLGYRVEGESALHYNLEAIRITVNP